MSFNHQKIDAKWQQRWESEKVFEAADNSSKPKQYLLVEFPYPSGAGLHVGHPRSYTAIDVIARKRRMEGYNVLFPMGWDAFGLPAEAYAIKTGIHPAITTKQNIETFRRQLKSIGFSFDWSREVDTTDPKYYRWTQWMFNQFFKAGLAYKAKAMINWCPKDKIGLANEEVAGGCCERCGTPVEKREKEQWMLAITKYADRLLEDLKTVDYLPKIKKQQEDWIGKSEGLIFHSPVKDTNLVLETFSAHFEAFCADTFLAIAPDHPLLTALLDGVANKKEILKKAQEMVDRREAQEHEDSKEINGIFTGRYTIDPIGNGELPIWIASFALANYGTGIIKCSAHDERDFAFAKKYGIALKPVLFPTDLTVKDQVKNLELCFTDTQHGTLSEPAEFAGKIAGEYRAEIATFVEARKYAKRHTTYKLRDWIFSRQRYWGEPIPLVRCESGCALQNNGWLAVPDAQLPVVLPPVEKYEPTDNGESPLSAIESFVNTTCPTCAGPAKRETDTMPNWAGSSWYFLRYIDPNNDEAFASKEGLKYWTPVDLYNGGMEHTTLHLLYSRFWHKFLFDQGLVPTSEPYLRRHSHGLIMSEDGTKMSKSKGNVVNPDEVVAEFGADCFRAYLLFMGPFEEPVPWSKQGLTGIHRFLDKLDRLAEKLPTSSTADDQHTHALHQLVERVSQAIENFKFNTAIADLMKFLNSAHSGLSISDWSILLRLVNPFAPHLTNEIAERLGLLAGQTCLESQSWPIARQEFLVKTESTIVIQINGKLRANLVAPTATAEETLVATAKQLPEVAKYLTGEIKRTVVVPEKLINFVI
ncbi:MAG: leucine--tRNA ligase [Patescibacteria group bacterium]